MPMVNPRLSAVPPSISPTTEELSADSNSSDDGEIISQPQDHDDNLLIVMDWDDTLFPTHVMRDILLSSSSENEFLRAMHGEHNLISELDEYCDKLYSLLDAVISYYGSHNLFIITNAQDGWIDKCLTYSALVCHQFKRIHDLLFTTHSIAIVSAQSMFSKQLPYSAHTPLAPFSWKQMAFRYLLNEYLLKSNSNAPPQLLTIGDQPADHHLANRAVREFAQYKPNHHMMHCKMEPNVKEMVNELSYIMAAFRSVLMEAQFMKILNERKRTQMIWDCEHMRFGYYESKSNVVSHG
eukprot:59042_1